MLKIIQAKFQYYFTDRKYNFMERRPWTPYEDQVLKDLYEKVKLNKWSLIARRMEEEFRLPQRNGKQCRQRYNNHLNPLMAKQDWNVTQQSQLFRLHDELGNKWAIIASKLGGRTDNAVKNHFFAKLRKSMRKINKIIQDKYKKQLKEVKLNVLYKIIEASQQKFKKQPLCSIQTSKFSCSIKNRILAFAFDHERQLEWAEFQKLIYQVHQFGKNYKRKPKQLRRIASEGAEIQQLVATETIGNQQKMNIKLSSEDSEDEIVHEVVNPTLQQVEYSSDQARRNLRPKKNQFVQSPPNVQQLLENQGLLEQQSELPPLPGLLRKQTSSEFQMMGQPRQNFFLDQSEGNSQLPMPMGLDQMKKESQDHFFSD